MNEEKLGFPEMSQDGKVNAVGGSVSRTGANRFLRIKVNNSTGTTNVDVRIPLKLVKIATRFAGMNFVPKEAREEMRQSGIDFSQIDFDELIRMIDEGLADGRLVDVDVEDPKDGRIRVEIFVN